MSLFCPLLLLLVAKETVTKALPVAVLSTSCRGCLCYLGRHCLYTGTGTGDDSRRKRNSGEQPVVAQSLSGPNTALTSYFQS